MSVQAMAYVFEHSPLDGAAFMVHLAIADSANDQHGYEIWMSHGSLSKKAHVSVSAVRRALPKLVEAGFLRQTEFNIDRPNRYVFLFPKGGAHPEQGDVQDEQGDVHHDPQTQVEPKVNPSKIFQTARSAPESSSAPTDDQLYLLKMLFRGDPNWSEVTIPALVQLNRKYGTEVVHMALQRLRESTLPSVGKPYGFLVAVCEAVARESA